MADGTTFFARGFEYVLGRLVATTDSAANSQTEALLRAETLARRLPGAAAFAVRPQRDGTEVRTILGAFGDVPDDVIDGLAGG
ncbi:hypothetical protein [Methylobacterium brachythecii]|uniref:Uncharacterized protein n=1 Tax=Methylobacterium brachythecii TaxID=1176177 RepID=A0A7W6AH32_9HYPH|nr:hypothetical protein [Methylobacterium brachythecii]MBB3902201.1 hypothetical protein [Methylobacterium brachythecii]GLS42046.1 hypothetical protein GCM10007884_00310 [Methylobacterium brachythecii]